jgi:phage repressor protein C with HTH and peptisase S24 domain
MAIENELKSLIINKSKSIRQFSSEVDIPATTIQSILNNGIENAGVKKMTKICNYLGLDIDALADGYIKEKTVSDIPMTVSEINHIKKYRSLSDYDKETVNGLVNRLSDKPTEFVQIMPPIIVPFYGEVASAGTGQFVFDDIPPEMIEIENNMNNMHVDFAIGVNGDSMEPTYSDGDTLLIKKQDSINIGEIGIFMIDGEAFVKELGDGVLISHNKDYEDRQINENTICLGKVIGKHIK